MTEVLDTNGTATRRGVLLGAGALGAGAILAACGGEEPTTPNGSTGEQTEAPAQATEVKSGDVPVGGGTILKEQNTVVTQPTAGEFKAFSATCTHQQCVVANISGGMINCTCHGSQFNIADGSVAKGPAVRPLTRRTVTVNGDTLSIT